MGLGISPLDILMEIPRYPKPGSKTDATGLTIQGGGPVPTAMVTLARLGMRPGLLAAVGNDLPGRLLEAELNSEGVDTSFIIRKKRPTAIASGWIERGSGRRTIILNLDINIKPHEIDLSRFSGIRAVHLDGRYLPACLKLARWAKRKGVPIVFDIGSIRNEVTEILPLVDHLVCAADFALPYTRTQRPRRAIERLGKICSGTIVVTSGIKGSLGFSEETGFVTQRAYRVREVDTTGAGDVYHGAYIFGLLKGWRLPYRLEFASAAAALKCTSPGGRTGIPDLVLVKRFLANEGRSHA
jgi:sulfofructose kinase